MRPEDRDVRMPKLQWWRDGGLRSLTAFKPTAFSEPVMAMPKRIIPR